MRQVDAGWSSLAARRAHNPKVVGSNPAPATKIYRASFLRGLFIPAAESAEDDLEKLQ